MLERLDGEIGARLPDNGSSFGSEDVVFSLSWFALMCVYTWIESVRFGTVIGASEANSLAFQLPFLGFRQHRQITMRT